jgi:predicted RecA/RadA family phage recombinase
VYGIAFGVIVGKVFGIATLDGKSGTRVDCMVEGVVELKKAAGALAQGAAILFTENIQTAGASGTVPIGVATEPATAGATTVRVKLVPGASGLAATTT